MFDFVVKVMIEVGYNLIMIQYTKTSISITKTITLRHCVVFFHAMGPLPLFLGSQNDSGDFARSMPWIYTGTKNIPRRIRLSLLRD